MAYRKDRPEHAEVRFSTLCNRLEKQRGCKEAGIASRHDTYVNRMIRKQRFAAKRREKEMRIRALLCKRKDDSLSDSSGTSSSDSGSPDSSDSSDDDSSDTGR